MNKIQRSISYERDKRDVAVEPNRADQLPTKENYDGVLYDVFQPVDRDRHLALSDSGSFFIGAGL